MPTRPELPTTFRSRTDVAYSVAPDVRDLTWTLWSLEECVGEFSLEGGMWHSHDGSVPTDEGFETWDEAAEDALDRWRRAEG